MQVKLVLQHNKFYVESPDEAILRKLAKDPVICEARVLPEDADGNDFQVTARMLGNQSSEHAAKDDASSCMWSFWNGIRASKPVAQSAACRLGTGCRMQWQHSWAPQRQSTSLGRTSPATKASLQMSQTRMQGLWTTTHHSFMPSRFKAHM